MSAQAGWWATFFEGPTVDSWIRAPLEAATKAEVGFLEDALGLSPGAKVLDVPCGGGRHALPLAGRGYEMTGVDLSPSFLDVARALSRERGLAIDWEEREMRDLPWRDAFDAAYCLGNSFGYLDGDDNAAFLRAVAGALRPGARFVLESGYIAETLFPVLQERSWYPDGDGFCLAERHYEPAEGWLHVAYTYLRDGRAETRPMSARVFTAREVVALLGDAGFAGVEVFGSTAREPFRLGSSRLLAVATRT